MNKYEQAIEVASKAHEGQFRRGSGLPYVSHPIAVSMLVEDNLRGKLEDAEVDHLKVIAVLHDTIEDTDITYDDLEEKFSTVVALNVHQLSKQEGQTYFDFLSNIYEYNSMKNVKIVKYFDMQHNLSDSKNGAVGKAKADLYRTWSYFLKKQLKEKYNLKV
jgi:GTP diphosphokinase / guanosine-3',5'-bis(diphosphate) 3'-diphosphatase